VGGGVGWVISGIAIRIPEKPTRRVGNDWRNCSPARESILRRRARAALASPMQAPETLKPAVRWRDLRCRMFDRANPVLGLEKTRATNLANLIEPARRSGKVNLRIIIMRCPLAVRVQCRAAWARYVEPLSPRWSAISSAALHVPLVLADGRRYTIGRKKCPGKGRNGRSRWRWRLSYLRDAGGPGGHALEGGPRGDLVPAQC